MLCAIRYIVWDIKINRVISYNLTKQTFELS